MRYISKGRVSLLDHGNGPIPCPYCSKKNEKRGSGYKTVVAIHPSHKMTKFKAEILAPCGTPRLYAVRYCKECRKEEQMHVAGHFLNGLQYPCTNHT